MRKLEFWLYKEDGRKVTQYLAAITVAMLHFTTGIFQGWPSPSLKKLLSDEYPLPVTSEEASYITIIGPAGDIIGGFLAAYLSDRIGRKITLLSIGIPQVLSATLLYFSFYSKTLLYGARILGGIAEGGVIAMVPMYTAEIAEPTVRGQIGGFMASYYGVGALFINILGSYTTIHTAALICIIFPIIFWCTFIFMPESPYYYLMKNNINDATICLQLLRRKADVKKEISQLTVDVQRQMSERGTYKDIFCSKTNRKIFIIVTTARFFQLFSGYSAIASYCQIMMADATNLSPVMGSSLFILASLIMFVSAMFYIDKVGRRPMFIVSSLLCFCTLISMAIFLTIKDYSLLDLTHVSYLPLIFIVLYNIFFCGGIGSVILVFISEVYSSSIKSKALALGSVVFAVVVILNIKIYQYTADNFGMMVPFYIFATSTSIGTIYYYRVIPETKGKSLETIQQELRTGGKKYLNQKV